MDNIWLVIGCSVASIIITLVVSYFLPKEKIRAANQSLEKEESAKKLAIQQLITEYAEKEKELNKTFYAKLNELTQQEQTLTNQIQQEQNDWEKEKAQQLANFTQQTSSLQAEVRGLEERKTTLLQTLEQDGEIFKKQQMQIVQEQIDAETKEMQQAYEIAAENAKKVYLEELADAMADFLNQSAATSAELKKNLETLDDAKTKAHAAVEANKRAELNRTAKDFYRLQLADVDLQEISKIRSIEPYLRDKEPLNKVIWKVYYEKPYTDLIGRVVGTGRHTGIYKITNLENQMCYVGQAVDIADRWKQHIRRGVGADPPTRNKLYPAMLATGVENFTFEIVEECETKLLNEREDYWQQFFGAKEFGYSIK